MISEHTLKSNSFVENTVECYRSVLFLIIWKRTFSPYILRILVYTYYVCVTKLWNIFGYFHQYFIANCQLYSRIFQQHPFSISLLTLEVLFTYLSSHYYQLSSHTTFCVVCSAIFSTLQLCFKINQLISLVCHVTC